MTPRWYGYLTETSSPLGWADAAGDLGAFVAVGSVTASSSGIQTSSTAYVRPLALNAFDLTPAGFLWAGFGTVAIGGRACLLALGVGAANRLSYMAEVGNPVGKAQFVIPAAGNYFGDVTYVQVDWPNDGAEHFFAVWLNPDTGVIGIRVDNTTATVPFTGDVDLYGAGFRFGGNPVGGCTVGPKLRKVGFYAGVPTSAELNAIAAGGVPFSVPSNVTAGERVVVGTPANGEASLLYAFFGDPETIPDVTTLPAALYLFVDGEYVESLTVESGGTWYVAATTLDTATIATGTHTATLEWVTTNADVDQPEKVEEAEFVTTEVLPRAKWIDPICIEPGGSVTIRRRGLMTDGTAYTPDPWEVDTDDCGTIDGDVFTAAATEMVGYTDTTSGETQIVVRQNRGIAHLGPDGNVRYGYASGSKIYVGTYQFTPLEFAPDKFGLTVRDQFITAGLIPESGLMVPPTGGFGGPTLPDLAAFLAQGYYTTSVPPLVAAVAAYWPDGDVGGILDEVLGNGFAWLPDLVNTYDYFDEWLAASVAAVAPIRFRYVVGVDEWGYRYGNDPENYGEIDPEGNPGYAPLAPIDEAGFTTAELLQEFTDAGVPALAPGMFGGSAGAGASRTYSTLLNTTYSPKLIVQYQTATDPSSTTLGSSLKHLAQRTKYASRMGDPARAFSTNAFGTLRDAYKHTNGSEVTYTLKRLGVTTFNAGAGLWIAALCRSTVIRIYAVDRYAAAAERASPSPGSTPEVAFPVRPGVDDEWDVIATHAEAIKDYWPLLLGTETSHPGGGPDFLTGYRTGDQGRIYVAVNLSRLSARLPPFAFDGLDNFDGGEVLDGAERSAVVSAAPPEVPGGGVLILVADPVPAPPPARPRFRSPGRVPGPPRHDNLIRRLLATQNKG